MIDRQDGCCLLLSLLTVKTQPTVILQRHVQGTVLAMLMKLSPVGGSVVDLPAPILIGELILLLVSWRRSRFAGKRGSRRVSGGLRGDGWFGGGGGGGCRAAFHFFLGATPSRGGVAVVEQNDLKGRLASKLGVVVDAVERAHSR
jgi:hypothetical protein